MDSEQSRLTDRPLDGREARSDGIRADIEQTRQEMDQTLDQLGERLKPRHLVDDMVEWWQSASKSGTKSGATALQSLGKTLAREMRDNPVPSLLIGAGLAWLLFKGDDEDSIDRDPQGRPRRRHTELSPEAAAGLYSGSYVDARTGEPYATFVRETLEEDEASCEVPEGPGLKERAADVAGRIGERTRDIGRSVKDQAGSMAGAAQDALSSAAEKLGDTGRHIAGAGRGAGRRIAGAGRQVGQGARSMTRGVRHGAGRGGEYLRRGVDSLQSSVESGWSSVESGVGSGWSGMQRGLSAGQERFCQAADDYPLGVGIGFLAAGVLAGLAIPSTRREDRMLGAMSDDLKGRVAEKGQEILERGQEVAQATLGAVREKAEEEGFTSSSLGEKVRHIAQQVQATVTEAVREEGLAPSQLQEKAKDMAQHVKQTAVGETQKHASEMAGHAPDSQDEETVSVTESPEFAAGLSASSKGPSCPLP